MSEMHLDMKHISNELLPSHLSIASLSLVNSVFALNNYMAILNSFILVLWVLLLLSVLLFSDLTCFLPKGFFSGQFLLRHQAFHEASL